MERQIALDELALRVAMARKGVRSVSRLARRVKLSESYGRQIAHGLVPSEAVRTRIAQTLGVDPGDLWPPIVSREATAQHAVAR